MNALWKLSAREVAARVSAREVSASEVTRDSLARLAAVNPRLNAVIEHEAAWSLAQASAVDQRLAQGERLPLAGVPVTVKDNIWVAGRRITQGSRVSAAKVSRKEPKFSSSWRMRKTPAPPWP